MASIASPRLRRSRLCIALLLAAFSLSGCVNHFCGPAYPNSTDPFCEMHHWPPPK